jgi:hypothetical protein
MTAGWGTVSAVYLVWNSRSQKHALLPTTHAG